MVNFVDTSVLLNLLQVPNRCQRYDEIKQEYERCFNNGDSFVFPMATLVETGNHIAHIADGNQRWTIANRFADLVEQAGQLKNNMSVIPELTSAELTAVLQAFRNCAIQEVGFGDASIIEQYNTYWREKQPIGEIRIWSTDTHLCGYHQTGGLARRRTR